MRERVVLFMVRFVVHDFEGTVDLLKQHDSKILVLYRMLCIAEPEVGTMQHTVIQPV